MNESGFAKKKIIKKNKNQNYAFGVSINYLNTEKPTWMAQVSQRWHICVELISILFHLTYRTTTTLLNHQKVGT